MQILLLYELNAFGTRLEMANCPGQRPPCTRDPGGTDTPKAPANANALANAIAIANAIAQMGRIGVAFILAKQNAFGFGVR